MLWVRPSTAIYFYLILFSLVVIWLRFILQATLPVVFLVIPHFQYFLVILPSLLNANLFKPIHLVIIDRLPCLTIHYCCFNPQHDLTSFLQLQELPFFFSRFLSKSLYVFYDSISIFVVLLCNSVYYHNIELQFCRDMKWIARNLDLYN